MIFSKFRKFLPLIDLHRHLEGNVRINTIIDIAKQHNINLPAFDCEQLKPYVQVLDKVPNLIEFISKFEIVQKIMIDHAVIRRIAYENVEDAAREGIDYIELRFSPHFIAKKYNLDINEVTEAICDGIECGVKIFQVKVNLIVIMLRNFGVNSCFQELETAIHFRDRGIVAIDLAGDEANFPGTLFVNHFRRARDAGFYLTAHAGEAAGAESVKQAILDFGVSRIGHGVHAIKDELTLDLIRTKEICLEICVTSNIHTNAIQSYENHPLKQFLTYGILATLNTDDPGISGINLLHEYNVAKNILMLDEGDFKKLQENAIEAAFLSKNEKRELKNKYTH